MKKLIHFFFKPTIFGLGISAFCILALAAAFIAQYGFDMKPCILCIYQRIPFAINIVLGFIIFLLARKSSMREAFYVLILAGIVFITNSALAFYHTGVEQLWWESVLEGCKFDPTNLRSAVYEPPVPCNIIPWQDPVLGVSMAGWNVVICGIAGIKTIIAAFLLKKTF